ncbi:transposase [Rhizobium leguminosarum]|uniref:transposase n=1 Tax=Rhizobium leguminosarum TaxID=384 RepID=UPI003D7C2DF4
MGIGAPGLLFRYKDYRRDGADRQQIMTLAIEEFIRRFLLHVLPRGPQDQPRARSRTAGRRPTSR